ncbi:MAG: CRISPR-associated endonuclease Cas2 [Candidatus Doudnabacteria bacterium]|nr:CRISPR-associated endonuclease Cas2 [Candidatus Doudnabacteria bacterium]
MRNLSSKQILRIATEELWDMIKELGLLAEEIAFTPYGKLRVLTIPRQTYYYRLRKFVKLGLVKKDRKKYPSTYILTEKAKTIRKSTVKKVLRKDGLSTVVLFDVPEEKHKARDSFRRFLVRNGYTQFQKSAFISPFKISNDVADLIKELKLMNDVKVFSGRLEHVQNIARSSTTLDK